MTPYFFSFHYLLRKWTNNRQNIKILWDAIFFKGAKMSEFFVYGIMKDFCNNTPGKFEHRSPDKIMKYSALFFKNLILIIYGTSNWHAAPLYNTRDVGPAWATRTPGSIGSILASSYSRGNEFLIITRVCSKILFLRFLKKGFCDDNYVKSP